MRVALLVLSLVSLEAVAPASEPQLDLVPCAGHVSQVLCVAFSGNGKYVITGSDDWNAIVWEAATGRRVQILRGHKFASQNGKAVLSDAASGRKIHTLQAITSRVTSVAFNSDRKEILAGFDNKMAMLWQPNGKAPRSFTGHASPVTGVALSTDGKQIVTGSEDESAILWEAASGKKLRTLIRHGSRFF